MGFIDLVNKNVLCMGQCFNQMFPGLNTVWILNADEYTCPKSQMKIAWPVVQYVLGRNQETQICLFEYTTLKELLSECYLNKKVDTKIAYILCCWFGFLVDLILELHITVFKALVRVGKCVHILNRPQKLPSKTFTPTNNISNPRHPS